MELGIEDPVSAGNTVAVRYTERGRSVKAFRGAGPTGRDCALAAMAWFEIRDGRVHRRWGARDSASQFRQLGLTWGVRLPGAASGPPPAERTLRGPRSRRPRKRAGHLPERRNTMGKVSVQEIQAPLRARYRTAPQAARVTDHAQTRGDPGDPFHAIVEPMPGGGATLPVGVHQAIGGPHDAPTPGDILCAALAACQDSAVRLVANLLGVELEALAVEVSGEVDVRGTMAVDRQVPVGFQSLRCTVRLRAKAGTRPELLEKLRVAAEHCCVVQQTLRAPPRVETTFDMTRADG